MVGVFLSYAYLFFYIKPHKPCKWTSREKNKYKKHTVGISFFPRCSTLMFEHNYLILRVERKACTIVDGVILFTCLVK